MKQPFELEFGRRVVSVYKSEKENVPTVYNSFVWKLGDSVIEDCQKLDCPPFNFVSVSNIRWDQDLSPWPHSWIIEKDDDFTGQANEYLDWTLNELMPTVEKEIGASSLNVLAGYSMAGLFALYAPYFTDKFTGLVSASGSVWYPGFVEYVREHKFIKKPEAIYLSLGEICSYPNNPVVNQTENRMRELLKIYQEKDIKTIFQLNPGDHYTDAVLRLSKGITWVLNELKQPQSAEKQ